MLLCSTSSITEKQEHKVVFEQQHVARRCDIRTRLLQTVDAVIRKRHINLKTLNETGDAVFILLKVEGQKSCYFYAILFKLSHCLLSTGVVA